MKEQENEPKEPCVAGELKKCKCGKECDKWHKCRYIGTETEDADYKKE